jgi:hypothetical protein
VRASGKLCVPAGLTAKQRAARKKPSKKQNNFRASPRPLRNLQADRRHAIEDDGLPLNPTKLYQTAHARDVRL